MQSISISITLTLNSVSNKRWAKFESQDVYFSTKKLIYVQTLGSRMLYISWRWPQLDPHISHAWCRNRDPLNPTTSFHKRSILSKKSLFLFICLFLQMSKWNQFCARKASLFWIYMCVGKCQCHCQQATISHLIWPSLSLECQTSLETRKVSL